MLPLRLGRTLKCAIGLLLLLVSQHYLVRAAFDSLSTPEIPGWLLRVEGWCFGLVIFLTFLTLARDLLLLPRKFTSGGKRRARATFSPNRRAAILAALAAVPASCAVKGAVSLPEVRHWEDRSAALPPALDGLNLVHLTDLHVSPLFHADWVRALVERVNAIKPDLILFSGDLADGLPSLRLDDAAPLAGLRARYGVFGCPGNHEYYSGYEFWMSKLPELGLTMLQNTHAALRIAGTDLTIAGITDPVASSFAQPLPDSQAALAGAPERSFKILLGHRPADAALGAEAGAHLMLSGHTHGGQILGMNRLVARFNNGYLYGWYTVGGMRLYVGSGTGLWNGFPLRLGVPSEIARIVLRRA
ncbi:MAG: metallophosphoesterase [Deltaproteobacteria bacterium]|nr:metallophosphoesterase [Deltaproteobacteria bacterium]